MRAIIISLSLIIASICTSWAQILEPIKLNEEVNLPGYSVTNPIISPDGKRLYFAVLNHPQNRYGEKKSQDIWYCDLQANGEWSDAERMSNKVNLTRHNALYHIMPDGRSFVINGVYTYSGAWYKRGVSIINQNDDDTWTKPMGIKIPQMSRKNRGLNKTVAFNKRRNVMVASFGKRNGLKRNNLYYTVLNENGKWTRVKLLKDLKVKGDEFAPRLMKDSSLIFSRTNKEVTKGEKKPKKNADFYTSIPVYHEKNGKFLGWGNEELYLDTVFNNEFYNAFITFTEDEEFAYFSSVDTEKGKSEIYRVKMYEKNPYVSFSGQLMNKFTNAVILSGKEIKVIFTEKGSENTISKQFEQLDTNRMVIDANAFTSSYTPEKFDLDIANRTMSFDIPFGKEVEVTLLVDNHISEIITLSTKGVVEHKKQEQNLYVEPLTYALVTCDIIDKKTGNTFSGTPDITVNGEKYESYTKQGDSYSMKLSLGEVYKIEPYLAGYNIVGETISLEAIETYTELACKLYVEKKPELEAYFRPNIMSAKDSSAIKNYKIYFNDTRVRHFMKTSGKDKVKMTLDSTYKIDIKADGFIAVEDLIEVSKDDNHAIYDRSYYLIPLEVGSVVRLDNVYFASGKSTLKIESYPALDKVITFLNQNGSVKIEIGGHTDNVGSAKFNKHLSGLRAISVRNYLVSKGIDNHRITAKGYGLEKPVASNDTKEGKKLNRRVEFTITEK